MPYAADAMMMANQFLSPVGDFDSAATLAALEGVSTLEEAARAVGAYEGLSNRGAEELSAILGGVPDSVGSAALAAVRSALERGLRVQASWAPAYAHDVRVWEVSEVVDGAPAGLVNVHVTTPHAAPPGAFVPRG